MEFSDNYLDKRRLSQAIPQGLYAKMWSIQEQISSWRMGWLIDETKAEMDNNMIQQII